MISTPIKEFYKVELEHNSWPNMKIHPIFYVRDTNFVLYTYFFYLNHMHILKWLFQSLIISFIKYLNLNFNSSLTCY